MSRWSKSWKNKCFFQMYPFMSFSCFPKYFYYHLFYELFPPLLNLYPSLILSSSFSLYLPCVMYIVDKIPLFVCCPPPTIGWVKPSSLASIGSKIQRMTDRSFILSHSGVKIPIGRLKILSLLMSIVTRRWSEKLTGDILALVSLLL